MITYDLLGKEKCGQNTKFYGALEIFFKKRVLTRITNDAQLLQLHATKNGSLIGYE